MGNLYRRKSSGNEEDPFFQLCCAGPNRFKAAKNAAHTPGSFSRPEFLKKGAEPQTVKQCALHAVAASLVLESGALHGARANAGFDLPLDDYVCLDGVSGILQVDAGALPSRCVARADSGTATKRLTWMVSSTRLIGCTRCWTPRLRLPWWLRLIGCTRCESNRLLAVSESLAVSGASGGHSAWRSRVGGLRWEILLWNPGRHLTMLTMSKHEVLVAHMVSMSCMVHARIHVWVHMLHAWVRLGCTVHDGIQEDILICTGVLIFMRWSSGRNKADEYEYLVPGRVSCCREASVFAGTRKVACRDVGRTQWEPQRVDFPGGGNHAGVCGYGDVPSPSSLLFRVTWTGQRCAEWGWVGH